MENSHQSLQSCLDWGEPLFKNSVLKADDCLALRHGSPSECIDLENTLVCNHAKHVSIPAYICIPLLAQSEVIGLLYLEWKKKIVNADAKLLAITFADQLALAISNIKLRDNLRELSLHDPLTGLYNRRILDEMMEIELNRMNRKNSMLAMLMIDIDHFKQFNDKFGHDAEDEVLKRVASTLEKKIRPQDFVCRFGGEEFIAVLSEITLKTALQRAQSLIQAISKSPLKFHSQSLGTVTISIGLALYPEDGNHVNELITAADSALYHAKNTGRNKVVVYKNIPPA